MKSVSKGCPGSEMFTRRTATVTISAPDAATAAAFCSKLLYLPVPTISREVKVRPATFHVSAISAAPHKRHDLIIVPILNRHVCQGRARHDLEIALHRNFSGLEPQLESQVGDRDALRHTAVRAIDPDRYGIVQESVPGWIICARHMEPRHGGATSRLRAERPKSQPAWDARARNLRQRHARRHC